MSGRLVNVLAVLVLLVLSLTILGNSMTKPIGRDEHMYCAAGVLMAQGKTIHRDFSYPTQLPYHPLLYAVLFKGLGTTHYLLVGRLVSVVADVLVMLCIVAIYRLAFGKFTVWGMSLGLCAAALYVYNPAVEYANGHAWNNDVVVLCVTVSLLLFIKLDTTRKAGRLHVAAIGALVTVATFMRMTTVIPALLLFPPCSVCPPGASKSESRPPCRFSALPGSFRSILSLSWPARPGRSSSTCSRYTCSTVNGCIRSALSMTSSG